MANRAGRLDNSDGRGAGRGQCRPPRSSWASSGARAGGLVAPVLILVGLTGCGLLGRSGPPAYEELPPDARALWTRARDARAVGDLDAARARLEDLATIAPQFFRGLREWQDLLIECGRAGEAERCATIPPPGSAPALTLAARLEPDPARAEAMLRNATAADPAFAWAWLGLGFVQRRREDHAAARRSLLRAVDLYPDFPEALRDLAVIEYEVGDARAARPLLERYLEARPDDVEARHLLASLLAAVVLDFDRAVDEYRLLVARDPSDVKALMGLAGALALGGGDFEEAAGLYLRALREDPSAADALYDLGWLCETRLGRPRDALAWYRRYLDYDGPDPDPRSVLYVVYFVPSRISRLEALLGVTEEDSAEHPK